MRALDKMVPTKVQVVEGSQILIIDDDNDQRNLLVRFIRKTFDCEILEADDGLEALRLLLENKEMPSLILLDLMMPYLSGQEFLTILRGRSEFDHIPVIVCTHLSATHEIRGQISHLIHSYLVKPIDKDKLLNKVLDALHSIRVRVDYV